MTDYLAIPPGVSQAELDAALARFASVVGPNWVFTQPNDLAAFLDTFAPGNQERHLPSAAVSPATVEEVQALVRIASETGVPLWTVSTGRNLAYGGAAPVLSGCVILDLKRLNRIIEVNEDMGYALVEPGVSFFDLHRELEARGAPLWISSPAPGWGSVIGNALERGFGSMPYGDHSAHICGMEVVLADGTLLRTGMGAMPQSKCWQLMRSGFGPSWDGVFTQSNLGVVTKMGIWLMPRPEAMTRVTVKLAREEDLAAAVDILRPLRIEGVINGVPSIRNVAGGAFIQSQRSEWTDDPAPLGEGVFGRMMDQLDLGWWTLQFGVYGRASIVQAQTEIARRAFEDLPGARIETELVDGDALQTPRRGGAGSRAGIPGLNGLGIVDWRGGNGGHIDFSPVLPPRGEDALKLHRMARAIIEDAGLDYMGTFYNFGRSMALICAIVFNRAVESETAAARAAFSRLIREVGGAGYGEYRTHVSYMDEVANLYSWNDHALAKFNHRIKAALDPAGVLSPGKQGVWSDRFRRTTREEKT